MNVYRILFFWGRESWTCAQADCGTSKNSCNYWFSCSTGSDESKLHIFLLLLNWLTFFHHRPCYGWFERLTGLMLITKWKNILFQQKMRKLCELRPWKKCVITSFQLLKFGKCLHLKEVGLCNLQKSHLFSECATCNSRDDLMYNNDCKTCNDVTFTFCSSKS